MANFGNPPSGIGDIPPSSYLQNPYAPMQAWQGPNQTRSGEFTPAYKAEHPANEVIEGKHVFVVDSRQRDFENWPNPNHYQLPIYDVFHNVNEIELKAALIPKTEYNIHSSNNALDVSVGDGVSSIIVEDGGFGYEDPMPDGTPLANLIRVLPSGGRSKVAGGGVDYPALNANYLPASTPAGPFVVNLDSNGSITSIDIDWAGGGVCGNGYRAYPSPIVQIPPPPNRGYQNLGSGMQNTTARQARARAVVGYQFSTYLRTGQYDIGGNPTLTINGTVAVPGGAVGTGVFTDAVPNYPPFGATGIASMQHWSMPPGLIREIQDALNAGMPDLLGGGVPTRPVANFAAPTPAELAQLEPLSSGKQYITSSTGPFAVRILNQYPELRYDPKGTQATSIGSGEAADSNCCLSNRVQVTLEMKAQPGGVAGDAPPPGIPDDAANVWQDDPNWLSNCYQNIYGPAWPGNVFDSAATTGSVQLFEQKFGSISEWQFLWESGPNAERNAHRVMGFRWDAVERPTFTPALYANGLANNGVIVNLPPTAPDNYVLPLVPPGFSYRANFDYCMTDDPKYAIIRFSVPQGQVERVVSDNDGLDRAFAALIFDNNLSDVLDENGTGAGQVAMYNKAVNADGVDGEGPQLGGLIYNNSTPQITSGLTTYSEGLRAHHHLGIRGNVIGQATQLEGTIRYCLGELGKNQRDSFSLPTTIRPLSWFRGPGPVKAMKGADFDRKFIQFSPPLATLAFLEIKFLKFGKTAEGSDILYDFHGREHLLIFEFTCSDNAGGLKY